MTNLIVKYLADKLDRVEGINVNWVMGRADSRESPNIQHEVHLFDQPHAYRNGKLVEVRGELVVDFGPPIGRQKVRYCDHPEICTLPLYIEGVKNVVCTGGFWPPVPVLDELEVLATSLGLTSEKPLKVDEVSIAPINFLTAFILDASQKARKSLRKRGIPAVSGTRIEVKGERRGEPTEYVSIGAGKFADGGISLATGVKLLAKGEIKVKGVYPPEGCIDPKAFLSELTKRGRIGYETEERTWELP